MKNVLLFLALCYTLLASAETQPNNEIWYTSSDENVLLPEYTDVFGATITTNTYSDGKGVITFDGPVTSIGTGAFCRCSTLTSVTIPASVTCIGESAFYGCSGLTSVIFDEDSQLTSFGDYAFDSCSGLTDITIPNSVTSIGYDVFYGCSNLTTITVEAGNPNYDSRNNCNAIIETASNTLIAGCKNTNIPNSIESIGDVAFCSCSGLTSVTIPNSVTCIGTGAFLNCSGLTSVTIPNSVTSIKSGAFDGCTSLTDVTVSWTASIPSMYTSYTRLPSVYRPIFGRMDLSNATLHVPFGTTSLYQAAEEWSGFGSIQEVNNGIVYTSSDRKVVTPNNANVFGATITGNTYSNGKGIIIFDGDVTSVGDNAFEGCSSLTSITLPCSVESIGEYAFSDCTNLTDVTVNWVSNIPTINAMVFNGVNLQNVTLNIPFGTTSLYEECPGWNDFGVIKEPSNEICYTSSDGEVVTPNNMNVFGATIMDNTYSIGKGIITFDGPITSVGDNAFEGCSSLTSIQIPKGVTSIGVKAFYGCTSLENVDLSDFQGTIDYCAFNRCTSIRNFTLSEDNPNCYLSGTGLYTSDHRIVSHFTPEGGKLVIPYPVKNYCHELYTRFNILMDCAPLSSVEFPCSWNPIGFESGCVPSADVWIFRSLNFPIYGECAPDIYVFECDSAHVAESTRNSNVHVLHLPESEMMVEEYMRNKTFSDKFAISLNSPGNNVEGYFFGKENCQPSSIYPNYFPYSFSTLSEDGLFHLTQFYAPLVEDIEKGNIPPIANSVTCANGKAYELESRAKDFANWFLETDTIYANKANENYGTYFEGYNSGGIWVSYAEEKKCDASCGVPNNTYWLLQQNGTTNPNLMYFPHMVPNMPYRIHALFAPNTEAEESYNKCKVQFTLKTIENSETEEENTIKSDVYDFVADQFQDVIVFDSVYTSSNLNNSIIIQSAPRPAEIRKGYTREIPFVGFWIEPLEEYDLSTGVKPVWQPPYAQNADVIYNLNGQKITTPQKGIYIQKGRKYLKK